ncbi:MAG: hypothetical protein RL376_953, partial [Verrucomicrobiota bacterium]
DGGVADCLLGIWLPRAQRADKSQSYLQRCHVMDQDQQMSEALIPGQGLDQI